MRFKTPKTSVAWEPTKITAVPGTFSWAQRWVGSYDVVVLCSSDLIIRVRALVYGFFHRDPDFESAC